jgi:hypothetical protein
MIGTALCAIVHRAAHGPNGHDSNGHRGKDASKGRDGREIVLALHKLGQKGLDRDSEERYFITSK